MWMLQLLLPVFQLFSTVYSKRVVHFTESQRRHMINLHNKYRRQAGGSNMQELVWDQNLANMAASHAATCDVRHSASFDRKGFGYDEIGENMWWVTVNSFPDLDEVVKDFHDEKQFYRFKDRWCDRGRICGHYTTLVSWNTCAVGCAVAFCRNWKGPDIFRGQTGPILVCNYGPEGNIIGRPLFEPGVACDMCPDRCRHGMCVGTCPGISYESVETLAASVPAPTPIPVLQSQSDSFTSDCVDTHRICPFWAANGECTSNPLYMGLNCKRSCSACTNEAHCIFWTTMNQCTLNAEWMLLHCAKQCATVELL